MRFLFAILTVLFLPFSNAHAAPELRVLADLRSADLQGQQTSFARHIIAFKDGQVVPHHLVEQSGCFLSFPYGHAARLKRNERLVILQKQNYTAWKPTCLQWEINIGCIRQGPPVLMTTLEWDLFRQNTGERLRLSCASQGSGADALVERQVWQSLGTLIVAD